MPNELPRKLGRYTLERLLARGGMGEIYLAHTQGAEGIDRPCVIKALPPGLVHDEEFVARFLDEARVVTTLSHGNIAQVFEISRDADEFFLVMEYIDGRDLRQILAKCFDRKIKPPPEVGLFIIQELLRGLAYAHKKGEAEGKPLNLIHRDVCPQNVMLSFEGGVKLIDFGLAKSALKSLATNPTILLGKVAYMSPEQARREKLDRRSDLYSAGVVLFEVVTGRRRYTEKNPQELLKKVRNPGPFVSDVPIPEPIIKLLNKALDPKQEGRYQTAEEFRKEITSLLNTMAPNMEAERLGEFVRELFIDKPKANDRTKEFEKPTESKASGSLPRPSKSPSIPPPPAVPPAPPPTPVAKPTPPAPPLPPIPTIVPAKQPAAPPPVTAPMQAQVAPPAPKEEPPPPIDTELTEQFSEDAIAALFGSQPDAPKELPPMHTTPSFKGPSQESEEQEEQNEEEQGGATIPAIHMPTEEEWAARTAARAAKAAALQAETEADVEPVSAPADPDATQQMSSVQASEPAPEPKKEEPKKEPQKTSPKEAPVAQPATAQAPTKPTPSRIEQAKPQAAKQASPQPPPAKKQAPKATKPAKQPANGAGPSEPSVIIDAPKPAKPKPKPVSFDDEPLIPSGPRTEVIQYPKPSPKRQQVQKQARLRTVVVALSLLLLLPSAALLTLFAVDPAKVKGWFGLKTTPTTKPNTTPTSNTSQPVSTPVATAPTTKPSSQIASSPTEPSAAEREATNVTRFLEKNLTQKGLLRSDVVGLGEVYETIETAKAKGNVDAIKKAKSTGFDLIVGVKVDANFIKKKTDRLDSALKANNLQKNSKIQNLQKSLKNEKKIDKKNELLNQMFAIVFASMNKDEKR